jgi:hypothetical protein
MYNNGRKEGGIVLKFEVGEILEITVSECSSPNCVVVDYDRESGLLYFYGIRIMNNSVQDCICQSCFSNLCIPSGRRKL